MENYKQENTSYWSAKKKVKEIKGFYVHLLVYLFVNIAIVTVSSYHNGDWSSLSNIWTYSTAFFWGIGLFAHWLSVFGPNKFFGNWEERKVRELMEKEKNRNWE
ncbi:2TM domain-containing protein [Autumnicola psychrophila]|uniref:2TM domain-containing protein n=1 Tax=Autumnicola psychrophila TaxID=3075592 RepID=A0ABU3DV49_9FLAO|nr:2TM domain-containing protein [Zunongwangia sp. F225]MDT0687589.1 2TM domain-containing protein [Zunongwangia sp. F225]